MHLIKKMAAAVLVLAMIFTMAACHSPNEVVVKVGDVEIRSGLYLGLLLTAQYEFMSLVDAQIEEEEGTALSSLDEYYEKKVDEKDLYAWSEEKALEYAQSYAATLNLFNEYGLEFTEEEITAIKSSADSSWTSYQKLYEENGVGYDSYYKTVEQSYMAEKVFTYYYGEGGTEEVSEKDLKQGLDDNYVLANTLYESFLDEETNEEDETLKSELKILMESYAERIEKGETFTEIYNQHNSVDENAEDTADNTSEDAEDGPMDPNASLLGGENTSYPFEHFDEVKSLKVGEATTIEIDGYYMLAVRKDTMEDPYYYEQYKDAVLQVLKMDEFTERIKEHAASLTTQTDSSLIKYYAPKKINLEAGQ